MEIRQKEGSNDIPIPYNYDNVQENVNAYRLKARDSPWIPFIGNPVRGMRNIDPTELVGT
jgi:hypothetical protein